MATGNGKAGTRESSRKTCPAIMAQLALSLPATGFCRCGGGKIGASSISYLNGRGFFGACNQPVCLVKHGAFQRHPRCVAAILAICAILALPLTCMTGQFAISPGQTFQALAQLAGMGQYLGESDQTILLVIGNIRLARGVAALFCGAALALAGAMLQGVLRNPLADPFTLGISAGAACGASLAIVFAWTPFAFMGHDLAVSLAAFCGAFLALGCSLLLGRGRGSLDRESVILAGIAVAAFLGAVVALVKALNEESVTSIVFWILGSLQGAGWHSLPILAVTFVPGALAAGWGWRRLDVLALGDNEASALGVKAASARFWLLLGASCMTAGCVAVAGVIGFVGLVAPHVLRLIMGGAHGPLLLACVPAGGIFLLVADCAARVILGSGQELPVGIVTSLAGAPFFAYLIWKRQQT